MSFTPKMIVTLCYLFCKIKQRENKRTITKESQKPPEPKQSKTKSRFVSFKQHEKRSVTCFTTCMCIIAIIIHVRLLPLGICIQRKRCGRKDILKRKRRRHRWKNVAINCDMTWKSFIRKFFHLVMLKVHMCHR